MSRGFNFCLLCVCNSSLFLLLDIVERSKTSRIYTSIACVKYFFHGDEQHDKVFCRLSLGLRALYSGKFVQKCTWLHTIYITCHFSGAIFECFSLAVGHWAGLSPGRRLTALLVGLCPCGLCPFLFLKHSTNYALM